MSSPALRRILICALLTSSLIQAEGVFSQTTLFTSRRIPNVLEANEGAILAFAQSGRYMRRSKNGGKSWEPLREVATDANGSVVFDPVSGDILVVNSIAGKLHRSEDGGDTWKGEPIKIHPNGWGHGTIGSVPIATRSSESGICLNQPPHKGRLVLPGRVMPPKGNEDQRWWVYYYNTSLFSDDRGHSWKVGEPVQSGTGEGALVELADGSIYFN